MRFGGGLLWGEIKEMGVKVFLMHGDVLAMGTVTNLMTPCAWLLTWLFNCQSTFV